MAPSGNATNSIHWIRFVFGKIPLGKDCVDQLVLRQPFGPRRRLQVLVRDMEVAAVPIARRYRTVYGFSVAVAVGFAVKLLSHALSKCAESS